MSIYIHIPFCNSICTYCDFCKIFYNKKYINDYLNNLKENDNYEEIKDALIPNDFNMIVTPKEIDDLIENMGSVVARGINFSIN